MLTKDERLAIEWFISQGVHACGVEMSTKCAQAVVNMLYDVWLKTCAEE